jgi:acyl dehydratase
VTTRLVRILDEAPAGLLPLARAAARRKHGRSALPAVEYGIRGQQMDFAALSGYQRLCGFRVSSSVPSTFVHVQAFPLSTALMGAPAFPFPLLGLVHLHNRITQHRPLDAAERLDLRVWADNVRDHPAGHRFDVQARVSVAGETVWLGTSTYLHRSREPVGRGPRQEVATAGDPVAYWRLPADLGRRYAAVSGDRNPIHLSRLTAKVLGFPRAIAHGMWLNARVLGALEPRLPDAYTVDVAFRTPTFLPSAVTFGAARTGDGWRFGVRNAGSGKPHLDGTITAPGAQTGPGTDS